MDYHEGSRIPKARRRSSLFASPPLQPCSPSDREMEIDNEEVRRISYQCDELRKIIGRKETDLIELREFARLESGSMEEAIAASSSKDEVIEKMKSQLEKMRIELEVLRGHKEAIESESEHNDENDHTLATQSLQTQDDNFTGNVDPQQPQDKDKEVKEMKLALARYRSGFETLQNELLKPLFDRRDLGRSADTNTASSSSVFAPMSRKASIRAQRFISIVDGHGL